MADPQYTPEQLRLIEQYYRAIGVSAETLAKRLDEITKDTAAFASDLETAERHFSDIEFTARDLSKTFKNVKNDLLGIKDSAKEGVNAFKKLNDIAESVARHQEDSNRLSIKELENLRKKYTSNNLTLKQSIAELENKVKLEGGAEKLVGLEKALYNEYVKANLIGDDRVNIEELLGETLDKIIEKEKNIVKQLNVSGAILKGTVGAMEKLGFGSFTHVLNLEKANEVLEDHYRKTGNIESSWKRATAVLRNGIKRAFKDPITNIVVFGAIAKKALSSAFNDLKSAFHTFTELNKESAQLGRELGTSADNAHHIVVEAKALGAQMGDVVLTNKDYAKAIGAANAALGLNVNLGAETNLELTKMMELMGLTAEESTNIYKLSTLNNQELSDTNKSIAAGIISAQKQYGIQANSKQVFQAIGKLSASTLANFKQNPEALAKAVVQAKKLGTDLDKMDASAQSLLNFEESIQNELEAELLTGKAINLEAARTAALNNDQVGYMNAIAEETGNLAEFNAKNRFAQEALAKAFGMSRSELAGMLQEQEVFTKLGDVTGKSAEEQLKIARERGLSEQDSLVVSLQQQATAEQLEKTFENIKIALGEMFMKLQPIFDTIVGILSNTKMMGAIIGLMAYGTILKMVAGFASAIKLMQQMKVLAKGTALANAVAGAIANPFRALAGLAVAGTVFAGVGALLADDIYSGYGDRTLVTPKGSYALNNNDTVIAGTNLFKGNDVISGPVDSINLTGGVESKLEAMTKSITALASRPVTVNAGSDAILRLSTVQSQYGAPSSFA